MYSTMHNPLKSLPPFALCVFLVACAILPAAAQNYSASSDVPYSYIDIASTGVGILGGSDDANAVLSLPFPFRFYGVSYSSVCVSSNGVLFFGNCPASDVTNLDLTSQSPSGDVPLIAPFWTDLSFAEAGAGSVVYQTTGSVGARRFVIQWNNAVGLNGSEPLNFQVVLDESNNRILFQYLNVESSTQSLSKGASSTVGIRTAGGNINLNGRLQWSYRAPVITNNLAILFAPPSTSAAIEVTSSVRATTSAFVYNRLTQAYTGTITITNIGTSPLSRPLNLVLTSLSVGVTATNATGTLLNQGPYYVVSGASPLAPGQSATVSVQFSNPTNARISFVVKTYSGAL
jgi:hypothetical protein